MQAIGQNQSESKKLQPNVAIFLKYSTAIVGTLNKKYKVSIDLNRKDFYQTSFILDDEKIGLWRWEKRYKFL